MTRLFIIDLDGVIFDASVRAHLVPELSQSNKCWEKHQAPGVVRSDPIHCDHVNLIKAMLGDSRNVLFLSSRSESNRKVTLRKLASLFWEFADDIDSRYICRALDDHRTAQDMKVSEIQRITNGNRRLKEIVIIEDSLVNVKHIMLNCTGCKIIPVILGYKP